MKTTKKAALAAASSADVYKRQLDTAGVADRKQSRSKYGAKRPKG